MTPGKDIWIYEDWDGPVYMPNKENIMRMMFNRFVLNGDVQIGKRYAIEFQSISDEKYKITKYHALLEELEDKECYEICKKAIDCYGDAKQASVAIEEMAELTVEILHSFRGREANVSEEIADVEIMLQQLKMIYNCSKEVEEIKDEKLFRLQERIEYEER